MSSTTTRPSRRQRWSDPTYCPERPRVPTTEREPVELIKDETGNCYAACISTITGIPFDDLKVSQEQFDTLDSCDLHNRMNRLLTERGFASCHLGTRVPKGYAIASGRSPRRQFDHAVVVLDGKFFHDPHPSNLFVPVIENYEVLVPLVIKASI